MPAPICVSCQLEMRCEQNERFVNDVRAGNFQPTYWLGDLFRCPKCHAEIVVGFGAAMDEAKILRMQRKKLIALQISITFARNLSQLSEFASQFKGVVDDN